MHTPNKIPILKPQKIPTKKPKAPRKMVNAKIILRHGSRNTYLTLEESDGKRTDLVTTKKVTGNDVDVTDAVRSLYEGIVDDGRSDGKITADEATTGTPSTKMLAADAVEALQRGVKLDLTNEDRKTVLEAAFEIGEVGGPANDDDDETDEE